MSTEQNNQDQNNNESGKILKKYNKNISKLTAVLSGHEKVLTDKKIPGDAIGDLVEELLKEKKEESAKLIKEDLKALLDKKVAMDRSFKEEENKLNKLKEQKMKEFNEACDKVLNRIGDIDTLEKNYYDSLNTSQGFGRTKEDSEENDKTKKTEE